MKLYSREDPDFPWETYVNHPDWSVRFSLAQGENTPPEILQQLTHDEDSWVLYAVENHPNSTSEILEELAKVAIQRGRWSLLESIKRNQKCSEKTQLMIQSYLRFEKSPVFEVSM